MAILTDSQIAGYAKGAGFPPGEIATAVAVALAESSGRTDATNRNSNGSRDYGLWQINSVHSALLASGDKFNPADNARMAYQVWKSSGWRAWSTYKSGRYRAYLPRGTTASGAAAIGGGGGTTDLGASFPSLGNPFESVLSGGLWARLGVFILGGLLFLIGFIRMSGIGSAALKTAKGVVAVRTGGLVRL